MLKVKIICVNLIFENKIRLKYSSLIIKPIEVLISMVAVFGYNIKKNREKCSGLV